MLQSSKLLRVLREQLCWSNVWSIRQRSGRQRLPARRAVVFEHLETRVVLTSGSVIDADGAEWTWHALDAVAPAAMSPGGVSESDDVSSAPPFPLSETFNLASRPQSNFTVYLDFDGHTSTGTNWSLAFPALGNSFFTPAYTLDSNPLFSNLELENIQRIWQMVAEDMAPFDVNVTTIDPGVEKLRKTGNNDTQWGMRAIVGNFGPAFATSGGIAFLNSFDGSTDVGCFTYPAQRGNTNLSIANTISHEVGHTFGLDHDGRNTPSEEYFDGHGTGVTSWGPIMGSGFEPYQVFQWSRGEYTSASNTEDDLLLITTQNGFTYRVDDVGNTIAEAQLLAPASTPVVVGSGVELLASGVIETRTDVDVFRLNTSGGDISIDLTNYSDSPNLDAEIALLDSTGATMQVVNPANSLGASLTATLAAGTYYVRVDGVGFGNVTTTGYSDYGSLGMYFLRVVAPINNPPVIPSQTLQVNENSAAGTVVGTVNATDPDGHSFQFAITAGNTGNTFAINPSTGEITVLNSALLDFEVNPVFTLTVSATDNGTPPATGTGTIRINLGNVNEAPTEVRLSSNTILEERPPETVVGTLTALDPDVGDFFTFSLAAGPGGRDNALFEIVGNELRAKSRLDFESTPTLFVRVRATDSAGNAVETLLTIVVTNVNEAPTNITVSPASLPENTTVGSNAITLGAVDPDLSDTFVFSLVTGVGSADNAMFTLVGNVLQLASPLNFEAKSSLSIRVRVTDAGAATFEKALTINVTDVNEAPSQPALSNNSVVEDVAGAVVGTLSASDPDAGDVLTFSIMPGLDGAQFVIVGNQLRAGAAGINFEAGTTRQVEVRVTDAGGLFSTQLFTINVLDTNEELTISATTIAENSAPATVVGTLSTIGGVSPYAYSLVSGPGSTDNGQFTIAGNQLLASASFDFETKAEYFVRVRSVSTGGTPAFERVFRILVTDQPESPTAINLTITDGALENQAPGYEVGTLSASDPDAGSTFTFSLVSGAGSTDNALFAISGGNKLVTAVTLDREAQPTRSVRVRVTDNTGRTFERSLLIDVVNVNEPPTSVLFAAGGTVPENAASFFVGSITSNDPDVGDTISFRLAPRDQNSGLQDDSYLFEIRNGNQVFTRATPLDYEAGTSRVIWVRAVDAAGLFIETSVTINVLNQNDDPSHLSLIGGTVIENVAGSKTVGTLATSDPDAGDTFTYTLVPPATGTNDNGLFSIVGNSLVTSTTFDFEARSVYLVRVRSTDSGGKTIEKDFAINIVNVNEAPAPILLNGNLVSENRAAGTAVGTFSARDPEGDLPIFELVAGAGDDSNGLFRIEGNVLRTNATLDFETASSHTIRVQARDISGATTVTNFTIQIGDDGAPIRFLRAYNRRGEYHFYTLQQSEFDFVVRQAGFRDETTNQSGFNVLGDLVNGASPIYRLYNFQTQRHYYTTNSFERDFLRSLVPESDPNYGAFGWRYERNEGFIFDTQLPGTVPIHRLYNNQSGVHLYTESITQRDAVLRQFPGIWESHGILGYAYPIVFVPQFAAATAEAAPGIASATVSVATPAPVASSAVRVDTLVAVPTAASAVTSSTTTIVDESPVPAPKGALAPASQTDTLDDAFRLLADGGLDLGL